MSLEYQTSILEKRLRSQAICLLFSDPNTKQLLEQAADRIKELELAYYDLTTTKQVTNDQGQNFIIKDI